MQQWSPDAAKLNKLIKLFLKNQLYSYKKLYKIKIIKNWDIATLVGSMEYGCYREQKSLFNIIKVNNL